MPEGGSGWISASHSSHAHPVTLESGSFTLSGLRSRVTMQLGFKERDSVLECGDRDAGRKPASTAPLSRGSAICLFTGLYPACERSSAYTWCRMLYGPSTPYSLRKRRRA